MLVKYTRPRDTGGFHSTESRVVEIPDLDADNNPARVPDGAVLAPQGSTPHDWQIDAPAKN